MIEEAAGTRMYESKKIQALKTMEKKQTKLNELESVCFNLLILILFLMKDFHYQGNPES